MTETHVKRRSLQPFMLSIAICAACTATEQPTPATPVSAASPVPAGPPKAFWVERSHSVPSELVAVVTTMPKVEIEHEAGWETHPGFTDTSADIPVTYSEYFLNHAWQYTHTSSAYLVGCGTRVLHFGYRAYAYACKVAGETLCMAPTVTVEPSCAGVRLAVELMGSAPPSITEVAVRETPSAAEGEGFVRYRVGQSDLRQSHQHPFWEFRPSANDAWHRIDVQDLIAAEHGIVALCQSNSIWVFASDGSPFPTAYRIGSCGG